MNFKKLGLKCGIEIHQQLDTHKLFCSCPSQIRDDFPDVIVERKLKAVVGETEEVDVAAAHEADIDKKIIYQGYSDTNCPIEFDEEPPRPMNREALETVLQVSKMLKAHVVDEVQVMRKTVVDGSNTSGFQRTALVARNGSLKTGFGNVGIPTIIVEEDAAKIVEQDAEKSVYNLSRLGIPLIEIGTDPDIRTSEQAKEVALKLGLMLRSTGKVKRGLGTIRQDLNISIKGGARVEIKGAQDLKMIPKWVENEALRQKNLIEIKTWLKKKKAFVPHSIKDVTDVFRKTKSKIIKSAIQNNGAVKAALLKKFAGYLGTEIQPDRRLGTELSDYAKVKAGVKGLFHSDENLSKYSISDSEIKNLRKRLSCKKDDAFILIADSDEKATKAIHAALLRADYAVKEIPGEVRRANPDGTTTFMRPIPGAARMYPETDCVPIATRTFLSEIKMPELIEEKERRYQKDYSLSNELARQVARFDYSLLESHDSFDDLVKAYRNIKPAFLAESIIGMPKELRRRFNLEVDNSIYQHIFFLFEKLNNSDISREAFIDILAELAKGNKVDFSKYKVVSGKDLESELKKIVNQNKNAPFGALMGKAMAKFRGVADGKAVSDLLKKLIK